MGELAKYLVALVIKSPFGKPRCCFDILSKDADPGGLLPNPDINSTYELE